MAKSIFLGLVLMIVFGVAACVDQAQSNRTTDEQTATIQEEDMGFNELTPEEERVIVQKGTEVPFTGKYYNHHEKGTYICKRCGAPLYISDSKFNSGCGWPSFDDEIPGAVEKRTDADGLRTEILCKKCGAHLGHVFTGEEFTEKNTRHCVNSISLEFLPATETRSMQRAIFAGGCFWGMEYFFQNAKGVTSTQVGYVGGDTENPTYKEVCYDSTGHAEAIEVTFDPSKTTYEELAKLFFEIHDPTQVDRQGPDVGAQYRSSVFYLDDDQKSTAEALIEILKTKGYEVATEVQPAGTFWNAEDYHQDYYKKNKQKPYCHAYTKRF
ncbi:MAG: bifunctional methionine sulfoxide reductase B/A protein [Candidatus Eisenbacteria bacterium]|uniref:Peptide methionine sulfoxide reductase MsrA n=1 Tax=Eiseniibacteriota bacterium TaxID=2212470 RepID=A0A948RYQ7_UNCEI|nr:bifunctional methionine sulfoxide reductase B/A protein [Candidatus Eisenbacteria bacterium]MBU1950850.1 bifunctional methionine sulfoxide reductase B/A protein [Candidatus Eisenbacteria bacterium]MBU2692416.1 bifunctional methionine sulfoxide reductase B/A protein [Candidatus Eisenbacteria bacterium]